jgi:hypothetical protein
MGEEWHMSHSPYGPSPLDAIAGYLEAKERDRKAVQELLTEPASPDRFLPAIPFGWPRQGIAVAQIVNRFGRTTVEPIIVIDFYRQAETL